MLSYKKFTLYFLSLIIAFLIFNITVWNFATKQILSKNDTYVTGDLARIGYITSLLHKRKNINTLPKKHLQVKTYKFQKLDMITLGDSFSNGKAGGLNRFYQDFIATYLNFNVLNIHSYKTENDINTIITLLNSGFLKKTGVKYILYESTQRKVIDRLTQNINFSKQDNIKNIIQYYGFVKTDNIKIKNKPILSSPKQSFINNGNFKYILYSFLYHFSDHAFISKTYIAYTTEKLFSIKPYNKFLFYKKDLTSIDKNTEKNIKLVNTTLNKLAKLLKKENITLIFMPVVTKYDLYSNFIINNNYKMDPFFNIFRKLKKEYIFIDTKKILLKALNHKEKDIFYCDDTHWSFKSSDLIAKYLKNLLLPEL